MKDETNPKNIAADGIAVIVAQLSGCSGFLSSTIGSMNQTALPTTAKSYRLILSGCVSSITLLTHLSDAVDASCASEPVKFPTVTQPSEVVGLVEFAITRLGVLMLPFDLENLPPGVPGTLEFEQLYAVKSKLARAYAAAIDSLQNLDAALKSPCHNLSLPEADRVKSWRNERKAQLSGLLTDLRTQRVEVEDALTLIDDEIRKHTAELADIDQATLFDSNATV